MIKAFPILFQGADKTVKGPDGLTAFEATDNQAIKALLQWWTDGLTALEEWLSCGLTLLPVCLSLSYLPASSAKYFRRGEGREKFITNQTTRKQKTKTMFWRRGKNYNQAFTKPPDQVGLFSISKNTVYTQGRAKTHTVTFDLLSSLANSFIRLGRGSDYTKANST